MDFQNLLEEFDGMTFFKFHEKLCSQIQNLKSERSNSNCTFIQRFILHFSLILRVFYEFHELKSVFFSVEHEVSLCFFVLYFEEECFFIL
jgi:hypothetical protein